MRVRMHMPHMYSACNSTGNSTGNSARLQLADLVGLEIAVRRRHLLVAPPARQHTRHEGLQRGAALERAGGGQGEELRLARPRSAHLAVPG